TPANLENDLKQCRYVSQAVMYGDRRPYPVALVTLDAEEIIPWAKDKGLPEDMPTLVRRAEVRELSQDVLNRANAKYDSVGRLEYPAAASEPDRRTPPPGPALPVALGAGPVQPRLRLLGRRPRFRPRVPRARDRAGSAWDRRPAG